MALCPSVCLSVPLTSRELWNRLNRPTSSYHGPFCVYAKDHNDIVKSDQILFPRCYFSHETNWPSFKPLYLCSGCQHWCLYLYDRFGTHVFHLETFWGKEQFLTAMLRYHFTTKIARMLAQIDDASQVNILYIWQKNAIIFWFRANRPWS